MKINKQHGFSVVEGLLIFIIVGIIGGTGWYVVNANKNVDDTLNNAGLGSTAKSSKKKQTTITPQADPTAGWTSYSSKTGNFSLKYPSNWSIAKPSPGCEVDDSILLLGANGSTVGRLCTDGGSHMAVYANDGDQRATSELNSRDYPDLKTENAVVGGVTGKKQSGTYNSSAMGIGPSNGDKEVTYTFYANNKTYIISYNIRLHEVDMPDVLSDFNLMVAKTLKFSAN